MLSLKLANQGRRGTPSRNIHLTEILGEDSDENVDDVQPLENNAHEVLPDGNDIEGGSVDVEMLQAFATILQGLSAAVFTDYWHVIFNFTREIQCLPMKWSKNRQPPSGLQ